MTQVDRATRCILSWRVVQDRTGWVVQEMLHESVPARTYYSDGFEAYQTALYWPSSHYPMDDKSETYSVEGNNADLRHYLARLARKSRCFSRCFTALCNAVKLFVFAYNARQLAKCRYPNYTFHVQDFIYP
jgi:IS1 family transposase